MLTKEDLEQLRVVVRDEVRGETVPIKRDIQRLNTAMLKIQEIEQMTQQEGKVFAEILKSASDLLAEHAASIKVLEDRTHLSRS
jgi:hypothetical protein